MRKQVERAIQTLQALDFRLDHEDRKLRTDRWIYTHSNAPDQRLILNFRMSDAAASKIIRHAEAIVGLASTETDPTEKAKRASASKRRETAERQRAIDAAKRRADAKEAEVQASRRRQYAIRQSRGTLTTEDRLMILGDIRGEWIDPVRIADELCIADRRVRDAINAGSLDAYMHPGKRVLCRLTEVREWVRADCPTGVSA